MKTEEQTRKDFAFYFVDLKAGMAKDGSNVNKFAEWRNFIDRQIAEERIPKAAANWKCPRSLDAELKK
jgi:hypothetical protein